MKYFFKLSLSIHVVLVFLFFIAEPAGAISFDSDFGTNGKTITTFGGDARTNDVDYQTDGKYISVGARINSSNNRDWLMARYQSNGDLDVSFANNGIFIKDFGGQETSHGDFIRSILVQPDGKIIVGGSSAINSNNVRWTLARLNSDGSLDSTFGTSGIVTTAVKNGFQIEYINDLLIQPDGKIIGIGVTHLGNTDAALVRYNTDGTIDSTFGTSGIVTTAVGNNNDRTTSAVLQPDGKIVVFGEFDAGGHDEVFLLRYNSNGSLDPSFGVGGKRTIRMGDYDAARRILLQPDGKLVASGYIFSSPNDTYVARFDSNGSLDNTFNVNGKNIVSFSSGNDLVNSSILQPDGKIILAGGINNGLNTGQDFMLSRFNPDGSIDLTFGNNGSFSASIGMESDEIKSVLLLDNKIVVVGDSSNGSYSDWVIARFEEIGLGTQLDVPLMKQTSSPWNDDVYDSANLWSNDATFARWGCAVTSAAMVFNYYGLDEISSGNDLNPGTLNTWLKSQPDGYIANGNTNWLALSRLSRQISNLNGVDFDALEFNRTNSSDQQIVKDGIDSETPSILRVPGHFIVGKGYNDASILINDPFYNRDTLSDYGNTFQNVSQFVPSNTDLSYIMLVIDESVDIKVFDENDNEIGTLIIEEPIEDPAGVVTSTVKNLKVVYIPKPASGEYRVEVSSENKTEYNLTAYLYDEVGNVKKLPFSGMIFDETYTYHLDYDKENNTKSEIEEVVTYQSLLQGLKKLHDDKQVKLGAFKSLSTHIKLAQTFQNSNKIEQVMLKNLKNNLKAMFKSKQVTSYANNYLTKRIDILIKNN